MPLTQATRFAMNVLLTDGVGTTGAPGSYFGFGGASTATSSTGPRVQAGVGNPNGVVTSPIGSMWIDSSTGIRYRNTTGGTVWLATGSLATLFDSLLVAPAATIATGVLATGFRGHLWVYMARSSTASDGDTVLMQVNADLTAANYQNVRYANGTSAVAAVASTAAIGIIPAASSTAGMGAGLQVYVMFPEETTFQKWASPSVGGDDRGAGPGPQVEIRNWRHISTAAIASYTWALASGANFITGSHFTLYGII